MRELWWQPSLRKHLSKYIVRIHVLERVLPRALLPSHELFLGPALIILSFLVLIAKSNIRLRKSLKSLLRLRRLILVWMHLE